MLHILDTDWIHKNYYWHKWLLFSFSAVFVIIIIIIIIMDDQSKCKSGVLAIGKSALGEGGMAYISVHRGLPGTQSRDQEGR